MVLSFSYTSLGSSFSGRTQIPNPTCKSWKISLCFRESIWERCHVVSRQMCMGIPTPLLRHMQSRVIWGKPFPTKQMKSPDLELGGDSASTCHTSVGSEDSFFIRWKDDSALPPLVPFSLHHCSRSFVIRSKSHDFIQHNDRYLYHFFLTTTPVNNKFPVLQSFYWNLAISVSWAFTNALSVFQVLLCF